VCGVRGIQVWGHGHVKYHLASDARDSCPACTFISSSSVVYALTKKVTVGIRTQICAFCKLFFAVTPLRADAPSTIENQ
jgi:formate dehydrogenase maturation protein FdhE